MGKAEEEFGRFYERRDMAEAWAGEEILRFLLSEKEFFQLCFVEWRVYNRGN